MSNPPADNGLQAIPLPNAGLCPMPNSLVAADTPLVVAGNTAQEDPSFAVSDFSDAGKDADRKASARDQVMRQLASDTGSTPPWAKPPFATDAFGRLVDTGDNIAHDRAEWRFDDPKTVANFDSHIAKSVPGYSDVHQLILELSDWFVSNHGRVVDLGCSTGTLLAALLERHESKSLHAIGVDSSPQMIDAARSRLQPVSQASIKTLTTADLAHYSFGSENSMVTCLYTLQFVPPSRREGVLRQIRDSLAKRGALFLVEKVLDDSPDLVEIYNQVHHSKKVELGFDPAQIYHKAQSLRGQLIPLRLSENVQLLEAAGFQHVSVFWRWCNWAGIIAIR